MRSKKEDWEKEFDEKFSKGERFIKDIPGNWIKLFIKNLLSQAYERGRQDKKLEIENEWQEFNKKMREL